MLILGFTAILADLAYKNYWFSFEEDRVLLSKGVLSKIEMMLPYIRIQDVTLQRTPFDKMFGLGSIRIENAGTPFLTSASRQGTPIFGVFYLEGLSDFREKARFLLEKGEDARLSAEFEKIIRETPPEEVLLELRKATDLIRGRLGRQRREVSRHRLDYNHLVDEKVIWPWFFQLLTVWAFFILFPYVFVAFLWPPFLLVFLALIAIAGAFGYWWVKLRRENYFYTLTSDSIVITHGVFGRYTTEIPYKRIQNINVRRGIYERYFNLCTLTIETAGRRYGYIPGITDPQPMIDYLVRMSEEARFDDALGDTQELEDYPQKILRQLRKVAVRIEALATKDIHSNDIFDGHRIPGDRIMSPHIMKIWGMDIFIAFTIICLSFAPAIFIIPWTAVPIGLLFLLGIGLAFTYPWFKYESYVFRFEYDSLYIKHGVITHYEVMIPYRRIQAVRADTSPLRRYYGLYDIKIRTAGASIAQGHLPAVVDPAPFIHFLVHKSEIAHANPVEEAEGDVINQMAQEFHRIRNAVERVIRRGGKTRMVRPI